MKYYKQYLEAKKLNASGYHEKALKMYNDLYHNDPDNDLINYGMGHTLLAIYDDIYNYPEIEIKIRSHSKKAQLTGIAVLGMLEEKLGNIEEARKQYKKAIKFGDTANAFYHLIQLEIFLGNVEEAKMHYNQYLENMKSSYEKNNPPKFVDIELLGVCAMYLDDIDVAKKIFTYLIDKTNYKKKSIKCLMNIEARNGNYEEAYQRYLELYELENGSDEYISLFVLYKLNRLHDNYPTSHNYYKRQLLEYDVDYAKSHIYNRHQKEFFNSIDMNNIFNICNNSIHDLNPIEKWSNSDKYILEFEYNIATKSNKPTNRVVIITIPNTKNILTIYPSITESKKLINRPLSSESLGSSHKIKRKSQIEKFNSRYNL